MRFKDSFIDELVKLAKTNPAMELEIKNVLKSLDKGIVPTPWAMSHTGLVFPKREPPAEVTPVENTSKKIIGFGGKKKK